MLWYAISLFKFPSYPFFQLSIEKTPEKEKQAQGPVQVVSRKEEESQQEEELESRLE